MDAMTRRPGATSHRTGTEHRRDERGDVPGWVLITVMTAALVAGLLAIAGPELNRLLTEALNSVG